MLTRHCKPTDSVRLSASALLLAVLFLPTAWVVGADPSAPCPNVSTKEASECQAQKAHALANNGDVYKNLGQYAKALEQYQLALAIQREIADRRGTVTSLNNVAIVYNSLGQYPKALDYLQQALAIDHELKDRPGERSDLTNLGLVYNNLGQYAKALDYLQKAAAISRELKDLVGAGGDLSNIGAVYTNLGQYTRALEYYDRAADVQRSIGDRSALARSLTDIGVVYAYLHQYTTAVDYESRALAIQSQMGDRGAESGSLSNIGDVYKNLGQYAKALDVYQDALAIQRQIGDRGGESRSLSNIGDVYKNLGQYAKALDVYQQALAIQRAINNHSAESGSLSNIGDVYKNLGQYAGALAYYEQAVVVQREIGDRSALSRSLSNIATLYNIQGQGAKAANYEQQALAAQREFTGAHAVQISSVTTGRLELSFDEASPVYGLAFSPNGSALVTAGDHGTRLWSVATGKKVWQAEDPSVAVAFSPDGKRIAEVGQGPVRLREAETGRIVREFLGHVAEVDVATFSPDGQLLATASRDLTIKIWDVVTGEELRTMVRYGGTYALAFSPDGRLIAAAGGGNDIEIFGVARDQEVTRLQRPVQQSGTSNSSSSQGSVFTLAFSPDGKRLAAGGADYACTIWDVARKEIVRILRGSSYSLTALSFESSGKLLMSGSLDHLIRLWDVASGEEVRSFRAAEGPISALAFSRNGEHIATATNFAEVAERVRTLYVLSVGVDYRNTRQLRLRYPAADATAVAQAFRAESGRAFDRVETRLLLDATKHEILSALREVADTARPSDTFVLFFAGHNLQTNDGLFFLPGDWEGGSPELQAFSASELLHLLSAVSAQRELVILDTPLGDAFLEMRAAIRDQDPALVELLDRSTAVITPFSGGQDNLLQEHGSQEHSSLTSAILSGLKGEAAKANVVTANSLISYLESTRPVASSSSARRDQPFAFLSGSDFPLIRIRKPAAAAEISGDLGRGHAPAGFQRYVLYASSQAGSPQTQDDRGIGVKQSSPALTTASPPRHDYALIFAGKDYDPDTGWPALDAAQTDADALREVLRDLYGFEVEIVSNLTREEMIVKLTAYQRKKSYGPEDQLLVMFAGHGDADGTDGYIVGRASKQSDTEHTSYLWFSQLRTILDNMPSNHVLLLLDTCFDGAFESGAAVSNSIHEAANSPVTESDAEDFVHEKLRGVSRLYLVSGGREPVPAHSLFMEKLLASLRDPWKRDGVLTTEDIYSEIERVKPRPHRNHFGKNEEWSDFIFQAKPKQPIALQARGAK